MAKKLRDAGWKQDSRMWWLTGESRVVDSEAGYSWSEYPDWSSMDRIEAPTAEEILRELPIGTEGTKTSDGFAVGINRDDISRAFMSDTLANAASSMWIYLKDNNLLSND